MLDLPWTVRTPDDTDLTSAREVLDADHHGLDEVKERIVEYLAVRATASLPWAGGHRRSWLWSSRAAGRSAR